MMFKTHPDASLPIAQDLYKNTFPVVFKDSASIQRHVFGLYLIDDMVKHLGFTRLKAEWPIFLQALQTLAVHPNVEIRICALYGLKVFVKGTPPLELTQFLASLLKAVGEAILLQKNNERDKESHWLRCRDNAVAVLGTLLQVYQF